MENMTFSQTASKLLVSGVPSSLLTPVGLLLFHPPYSSIHPCIHLYRFCALFKDEPRLPWETGCQMGHHVPVRANLVTLLMIVQRRTDYLLLGTPAIIYQRCHHIPLLPHYQRPGPLTMTPKLFLLHFRREQSISASLCVQNRCKMRFRRFSI
ncbi:uncharacterized protein EDB91DRAFT_1141307, partial [Suillus paluster]|uniref:uncharacterized protein n=1 Tax=Suillus paluster TaxID=48578 RepID=UPI001B886AA8